MDAETTEYLRAQIDEEFRRFEAAEPPPGGFEPLPDIPAGRYIDEEFFALEQEHIWSKSWLLAAHSDELPEVGSYVLWRNSGTPILIVRGRDDRIRAFYNTCRHRGGPLVREDVGRTKTFVCKYHCWAYDLDGTLVRVPDEHEFGEIDRSTRNLEQVGCERFGGWVFVNRDPNARPLREFLGAMTHEFEDFEPNRLRLVHKYSYELPVNWKITMDAFQEVYHLKHIHPRTVDQRIDHRGASMALFANGHSRMMVPARSGESRFVSMPASQPLEDDPRHEMTRSGSLSYNMFPNLVTPTGAVSFPFLLFWPIARDRTLFEVIWYTRGEDTDKDSDLWKMVLAAFDGILGEDNENLPWIQQSIDSGALEGVPLSYQERRIYHFHEYVDRVIGVDRIPDHLRVEPRLEKLEEDGKGGAGLS
jgi:phenylpropionate dioxygenase-like ring-hydroxylating dioxygenase large terminal subunit